MSVPRLRVLPLAFCACALVAALAPARAQDVPAPAAPAVQNPPPPAPAPVSQTPPAPAAPAEASPATSERTAPPASPGPAGTVAPAAAPGGAASSEAAAAPADAGAGPRPIPLSGRGMPELSPWTMFLNADILVKGVMLGLAFASLVTWTIFLGKSAELLLFKRRLKRAMARLSSCQSLAEAQVAAGRRGDVVGELVREAVAEARLSADLADEDGLKERVQSRFSEAIKHEGRIVRRGMGLLATIGSTSPFVGLFGTVWGIMNSFIGISKAQTTNLAVVAPGIAEALLATAIGLVAAIPAVIIYNHFARATKGYLDHVGRASGTVGRLLSRDLGRARGRFIAQAAE